MQNPLHIPTIFVDLSKNGDLYLFFYQMAMFAGILWLIYEGYRNKFPWVPWLLSVTMMMFFSIVGTKLSAWSAQDFQMLLREGVWPDLNKKSSIGGFLGGFIALLLAKRIFRFNHQFYDAFALFPMIVMFIQRLGCLFAGCCFGTSCDMGLGVQYFGQGKLRNLQLESGILESWQWTTHAVHAVPIYLMVAAFISGVIVISVGPKMKNAGSKGLLGLICMAAGRFIIEFVREPATNHALGNELFGLKLVQWVTLFILLMLTFWLLWNEKRILTFDSIKKEMNQKYAPLILSTLAFGAYRLHPYFNFFEKVVIFGILLGALAVILITLIRQSHSIQRNWTPVGLGMLAMVMMSQTFRYYDNDSARSNTIFRINQTYQDMIIPEYPYCIKEEAGTGCNGSPGAMHCVLADSSRPLGENYYQNNLSVEHYFPSDRKVEFMVGGGVNQDIFSNKSAEYSENFTQAFAEIGIEGRKHFGMKFGTHIGSFAGTEKIPSHRNSAAVTGVIPHMQFWVGNKENLTFEFYSLLGTYDANIMGRSRVNMNINLFELTGGKMGQFGLGYEGIFMGGTRYRYYLKSEILLPHQFTVVPHLGYTSTNSAGFTHERGYTGGLGLRYDLSRKY